MPKAKGDRKRLAALQREATKRGEKALEPVPDPTVHTDPIYVDVSNDSSVLGDGKDSHELSCELNPIKMVWGQAKRRFCELADGTFPYAKKLVPECLDAVNISNIHRYFCHCYRYMDAYHKGLNIRQADYAVKKYTSHRRIPASIMMDISILMRGATG